MLGILTAETEATLFAKAYPSYGEKFYLMTISLFTVKEENGAGNGVKAESGDGGEKEGDQKKDKEEQNGDSVGEKGDNQKRTEVKEEV